MGFLVNWNVGHSAIFVFICTFLTGVHMLNNEQHKTCVNVKNEFVRYGKRDLVPEIPQHVAHIAVCGRGVKHPGQRLCCSNSTVEKYHIAAEKYLKDSLHSGTAFLKKFLTDKLKQYEERTQLFLDEAQNRTSVLLTQMHNIPWTKHHDAVKEFFHHLEEYVVGENDNLHKSVETFFSKLFPSVFYYTLNDPSFIQMDDKYHDCLSNHYENIQPFGRKVPHDLEKSLKHSLHRSRFFVSTLSNIVEVMETTDNIKVENDCIDAVTRLQYCSRCHGHTGVKPCRGFCLNVMRGCLAKLSDISQSWDSLISVFGNLALNLKGKSSLKNALMSIDKSVFDGILEAMQGGPGIHTKVLKHCVKTTKANSESHPYEGKIDTTLSMAPTRDLSHLSLDEVVESVSKRLEDSKGMYNQIADGICRNRIVYAETMTESRCWNGTDMGRYIVAVPEVNIFSQAKSNKEVRVTVNDQQSLNTVKHKLAHTRVNVTNLLSADIMQGDEAQEEREMVYSSGDKRNTFVITDDEDFGPNSGSGSGDDNVTPVDEKPTETDIDKDRKETKDNSSSKQSVSILLLSILLYFYWQH